MDLRSEESKDMLFAYVIEVDCFGCAWNLVKSTVRSVLVSLLILAHD